MRVGVIVLPTNKPRYTITVNDAMLRRIDDFRFEHRYVSRSAATLELIRMGIDTIMKKQEESVSDSKSGSL
jgi:metal-responsive CopG/Arc/MetJ family transcriptional regulator